MLQYYGRAGESPKFPQSLIIQSVELPQSFSA